MTSSNSDPAALAAGTVPSPPPQKDHDNKDLDARMDTKGLAVTSRTASTTEFIRRFNSTGMELGVGQHDDGANRAWFVMDRSRGRTQWDTDWHTHCGPYSTREQAVDWILAIREDR